MLLNLLDINEVHPLSDNKSTSPLMIVRRSAISDVIGVLCLLTDPRVTWFTYRIIKYEVFNASKLSISRLKSIQ